MVELAIRFLVGGALVSFFAVVGDILKPKSFAGLFGAAPSVALATLMLSSFAEGKNYVAIESRSMIAGAFAFTAYALLCVHLMMRNRIHAGWAATMAIGIWAAVAFGAWYGFLQ
jgi:hypothetical protein